MDLPDFVCSEVYLNCMLPTLRLLAEASEGLSQPARHRVVKFAADRSLALSGRGSCWSAALTEQLRCSLSDSGLDTKTLSNCKKISEGNGSFLGFTKTQGNNDLSVHNPVEVHVKKQKLLANPNFLHSQISILRGARKKSLLAGNKAFCRPSRCSLTSRTQLARRCLYTAISKRKKNVNSVIRYFSFKHRSKATSCKLGSQHKMIIHRVKKEILKKSIPKRKVLRSVLTDEIFFDRLKTLQQLIPGGARMKSSHLLHEATDYIFFLKFQVNMLKSFLAVADERS